MMGTAESTSQKLTHTNHRTWLKNLGRLSGAVGLVLLASSPLTWLLTAEFGPMVWAKLTIGGLLVAMYLATNGEFFARAIGARSTGLLVVTSTTVVFVLGLVVAANYAAYRSNREFNLTREGLFTLSPQTVQVLKELPTDVHAWAFYPSFDPTHAVVAETLERYKRVGKHFSYAMVDPQSRPDLVEQYNITERGPRIVVTLAEGARSQEARAKEPTEQELTYAIMRATGGPAKKIYFLTGHREPDTSDAEAAEGYKLLADTLGAEGYRAEVLDFANIAPTVQAPVNVQNDAPPQALEVPADAGALIIAGPRRALQAPEVAAIEGFVNRGGRLCVLLEPHVHSGLEAFLRQWNVEVRDDVIIDTNPLNRLLGLGVAAPLIQPSQSAHPIVREINAPVVMLTARSLQLATGGPPDIHAESLAQTGESAWGETHVGKDGTAARDDNDYPPPLTVAIAATKNTAEAPNKISDEARVVVFGDSDWASNRYLSMQGNKDLILNAVHWTAEQQNKITIRPKSRAGSQLFLSGAQLGELKFFSMDILPVLIVAMGLGVVLIRRQR